MCQDEDEDDYPEFTLDDKTLAFLVEEESKFSRGVQAETITLAVDTSPPSKRQKTTTQRKSTRTIQRNESADDLDDLPDISVCRDGTYLLQDKPRHLVGQSNLRRVTHGTLHPAEASTSYDPAASGEPAPAFRTQFGTTQRPTPLSSRSPLSTRPVQNHTAISHSSRSAPISQSGLLPREDVPVILSAGDVSLADLHRQVEELRKNYEKSRADKEKMQHDLQNLETDLQKALDAKFAKDGEVTMLRKSIEKHAQDHVAQTEKFNAAREEADRKYNLLQKQFEAEIERIKTEYTFKQHELEIALRKPPGSAQPKRTRIGPPPTPVPVPSQIRAWGQGSGTSVPLRSTPGSPYHPRFGDIPKHERPKKPSVHHSRGLPPGFQVSSPTPLQFGGSTQARGKSEATGPAGTLIPTTTYSSQLAPPSTPCNQLVQLAPVDPGQQIDGFSVQLEEGEGISDNAPPIDVDTPHDVEMEGTNTVLVPPADEIEQEELLNWNIAMHRAILMHTMEGSRTSTLQLLMTASFTDPDHAKTYANALSEILDVLSNIPNHPIRNFDQTAKTLCEAFCNMVTELAVNSMVSAALPYPALTTASTSQLSPLAALFDLITNLTYSIPRFYTPLLSSTESGQDDPPRLLTLLCKVIRDELRSLSAVNGVQNLDLSALGKSTLRLLEALAHKATGDAESAFALVPRSPSVLAVLLHPSRPQWFLLASVRLLAWVSSMRGLFRPLLSFPEGEHEIGNGEARDLTRLPQIDLLCSLLTDSDSMSLEADKLKAWIVLLFGMLSAAHPDAVVILVESHTLIPSIILRLCHLADRVLEMEEGDGQAVSRTITMLVQTTRFLHHLVIGGNFNLRERLHRASMRKFNGLAHFFIEAFGRLSYVDRPDWIDDADKQLWEKISDMARTLLGLVVEGPEADLIWATYQNEADEGGDTGMEADEDMQAGILE
ncbi:hypothetical protein EDC04DRAFT_3053491 [Pisolithus marmoratus]|nr:hypothetical protein EDC04DRAFT_3053491 [Pisolithus marmoratus]